MSFLNKLTITDFKCMLCNELLAFDTDDPRTYLSKFDGEDFFSMRLEGYVVKHDTIEEEHVNVVIVDQNHQYRGHKDFYKTKKIFPSNDFQVEILPPTKHSKFELFLIIDYQNKLALEFVNVNKIKTVNLVKKIDDFIKKNHERYEYLPEVLLYEFMCKEFIIIKKDLNTFIVFSSQEVNFSANLVRLVALFNNIVVDNNSITNSIIALVLQIIDIEYLKMDLNKLTDFIEWFLKNNILYVPLKIEKNYLPYILTFLSRFPKQLSCANNKDFMHIFDGTITVFQYIQNNVADYACVKTVLDSLERRGLITKA